MNQADNIDLFTYKKLEKICKKHSIHTLDLPDKNKTQDGFITRPATDEQRIVTTKDADFLEPYILRTA